MKILDLFLGEKHAKIEQEIAYEQSRSYNNKQAIKSGVHLLVAHASNALKLVAEEKNAENRR